MPAVADSKCPGHLDNSGSDLRNLIGQLQVSKRGRNLERDSKCQWGGGDSKCPGHLESPPLALRIPPVIVIALRDNSLVATYALLLSNLCVKLHTFVY